MRAAVYTRGGPPEVARIAEVKKPVPQADEVLVKVCAAGVNPLDYHLMRVAPYLIRIPGRDVAGQVEAAGRKVTQFKPGDDVFGTCLGAFAEYACTSQRRLARKPESVTFEQAACAPVAGYTAVQGLRDKGKLRAGQKVLINGAAGGVGTFAVQLAKWLGAEVIGVCSTRNVELVRSLGADSVIDYTREDFTRSGQRYELLFDLVANHSLSECVRVLNPKGIYVGAGILGLGHSVAGILGGLLKTLLWSPFVSPAVVTFTAKSSPEDLTLLGELMAAGKMTPVIDRRYKLSEVSDAIQYLAEGHARGKVIISLT